jgi:hypothetical protein
MAPLARDECGLWKDGSRRRRRKKRRTGDLEWWDWWNDELLSEDLVNLMTAVQVLDKG